MIAFRTLITIVTLGLGNSQLQAQLVYPGERHYQALTARSLDIGDLNQDGHLDILSASINGSAAYISYGRGDGSFERSVSFITSQMAYDAKICDVNNDSLLDIVVVHNDFRCELVTLVADGLGSFTRVDNCDLIERATKLSIGDLNGDGIVDVLTTRSPSIETDEIYVCHGIGDGTFSTPIRLDGEGNAISIVVHDIDLDGDLDVITASESAQSISVLRNNGLGVFSPYESFSLIQTPTEVTIADLDGDGVQDIIATTVNNDNYLYSIEVLFGDGTGSYSQPSRVETPSNELAAPTRTDPNQDGVDEIAIGDLTDGGLFVLCSESDRELQLQSLYTFTHPLDIASGDLNGDGYPELVLLNDSYGVDLEFVPNIDEGNLATVDRAETMGFARTPRLADSNQDGNLDLFVVNFTRRTISSYLGDGTGGFEQPTLVFEEIQALDMQFANLNSDEFVDAIVLTSSDQALVFPGTSGGFGDAMATVALPNSLDGIVTGDFNGDNALDFAVPTDDNQVVIVPNDGGGSFGDPISIPLSSSIRSIKSADLNQDGISDLIIVYALTEQAEIIYGSSDLTTFTGSTITTSGGLQDATIHDYDQDGLLDILLTCQYDDAIRVFLQSADHNFVLSEEIASNNPLQVRIEDLNNDNIPDLFVQFFSNPGTGHRYRLGLPAGGYGEAIVFDDGNSPREFALGDLNHDLAPEFIAISDQNQGEILIYPNLSNSGSCSVDLNSDGTLNFFDVSAFLVAFLEGNLDVDFNDDGDLNFFDVSAFLIAFQAGCP